MILFGDRVVCSTGDLVEAARCEFALLRALDAGLGLVAPVPYRSPGVLPRPTDDAREYRLAELRDRFGSTVVRVRTPEHAEPADTAAVLRTAHDQTLAALRDRADAVANPVLLDGLFAASCDFLIRDSAPESHDYVTAAIATRRTRITTLLEQAACADVLRRNGFRTASHARLWLDGTATTHTLADIAIVYRARRARLDLILDAKLNELLPVQWGDRRFLACGQCPACSAELESRRDLLLVAGMRPAVRAQLRDAGITTVDRLAAADATVSGVPGPTFTALRRQAELQLHREHTGHPIHTVLDAAALSGLPAPTLGDLFVSVTTPGGQPSTDLLVTIGSGEPEHAFRTFMIRDPAALPHREPAGAHTVSSEDDATALLDFLAEWQWNHPGLRIHHYRGGVRPLLADLADTHPDGEDIVAALLPLLVDLYPIVRAALLVGERSYGLAHLPPNQFGPNEFDDAWPDDDVLEPPEGDHTAAVDRGHIAVASHGHAAVAVLEHTALTDIGPVAERTESPLTARDSAAATEFDHAGAAGLDHAALNEFDRSIQPDRDPTTPATFDTAAEQAPGTLYAEAETDDERTESVGDWVAVARLRDWLLELAEGHGVQPMGRPDPIVAEPPPTAMEAALREFADTTAPPRTEAQFAAAMTAAVLGYHRRERQPLRWEHADRLDHPVEEWADTPGVLVADWGAVNTDWHRTGHRPMLRYLTLTGRLGTGNAPRPGTPVVTLYDHPAADMPAMPGRRAVAQATVLGCALDSNFDDVVRLVEVLPQGCEPYDELPSAIAPCPPSREEWLEDAIEDVAHELLVTLPQVPRTATFDLLSRRTPRSRTGAPLPEVFGDHAAAVTAAVLDLADSYVAVQGPPGTGKTDIAARTVERLVTRYRWRVGVVARSHKAVEHLLDAVVRFGVLPELVAKAEAQTVAPEWLGIEANRYERFLDNAVNGCVVGGLPDDFADPSRIPRESLDLLVIADAGRFPLANAIAVSVTARNLLLVGDPAPTSGHGAHPEPVDDTVLGWLVGPHRTLPAEYGYFLDRTWRMHPRMCGPVSRLRYDNRLRSNETVTLARELDGVPPGVRTVTIEHHGNATESAEEAREIVRRVRNLLGLTWHTGAVTRRLHPHDILVIAPYHAQVARIRTLLSRARIEDVLVGTPDHFQGREAAVVLVSMTTSAPKDAPNGVAPLLSRHWLTSAISRAMWSAVIIRSPLLTEYLPTGTAELSDLAAFLQLDRV